MFMQTFKTIFFFLVIFFVRVLLGVIAGYLWLIAVAFIFYVTMDDLADDGALAEYYIEERIDDDLLEFYNIGQELERREGGYDVMAERVVFFARVGRIGFWVCPALGIIWGVSQARLKDLWRLLRKKFAEK